MMSTLQHRLERIMEEMRWTRAQLVEASGESSSVVSQWLGKGSKIIKTMGSLRAALRLQERTGYNALWIATGEPPEKPQNPSLQVEERPASYAGRWTDQQTLNHVEALCSRIHPELRPAFAELLQRSVLNGFTDQRTSAMLALVSASTTPMRHY